MKKYVQETKGIYGFALWISHDGIDQIVQSGFRTREVKKGKHNCVNGDRYLSYEKLVFGSWKAAIRYIREHFNDISKEKSCFNECRSIAIECLTKKGKRRNGFHIVWVHSSKRKELCTRDRIFFSKKRLKDWLTPAYKYNCLLRGYSRYAISKMEKDGRMLFKCAKDFGDETITYANIFGEYWTSTNEPIYGSEKMIDCGTDIKLFLKISKIGGKDCTPSWVTKMLSQNNV